MINFKPIQKLSVYRRLSTGDSVFLGTLAQSMKGVFFQYEGEYLAKFGNSSPFMMNNSTQLQLAPKEPHGGLHGLIADSLPDGWGRLLQDRIFRQNNIPLHQITAMDRLAFIGDRGMGALSFLPESDYQPNDKDDIDLMTLGLAAQAVFDGHTDDVLSTLVAVGSSGGARPKAQLYFPKDDIQKCRTYAEPGDEAWLVKFTSKNLPLGHDEGVCEAIYLQLAAKANLDPPEWKFVEAPPCSGAASWLAVKRFDWVDNGINLPAGRLLMHSASGLLDADFREPSLDYEELIKVNTMLCRAQQAGKLQFRRAIFNLFAANQDDHSKNWSFLQLDNGQWQPAPFYDVTYNPHVHNEHTTAFGGYGKCPPIKTIKELANIAGFSDWKQARQYIAEIVDALADFSTLAKEYGITQKIRLDIESTLKQRREENAALF